MTLSSRKPTALRRIAFLGAATLVTVGVAVFAFFYVLTPTRWVLDTNNNIAAWWNRLVLPGPFGWPVPLLPGLYSYILIWQWCTTLAAALGAGALLWLCSPLFFGLRTPRTAERSPEVGSSIALRVPLWTRRLLASQVPPRGLWTRLMGGHGLCVLDLLLFLVWLGLHIMWLTETTIRAINRNRAAVGMPAPPPSYWNSLYQSAIPPGAPESEIIPFSIGTWTGLIGNMDLLLLFFPLPRCNFLHWLLGSDFPSLLKYHRCLGHATIFIYSLHGIIYLALWSHYGLLAEKVCWRMDGHANAIAGIISLAGGWVLWLTALPAVRRRFFNLFFVSHILGAVVLLLFGFMHQKTTMPWIMPGVLLYLLDVVLRTLQNAFNCTRISAVPDPKCGALATVTPNGGVVSLSIKCDKNLAWVGSDIIFLNVPAVSWWQWHPFTVASAPCTNPYGEHMLALHIKGFNHWTKAFIAFFNANPNKPLMLHLSGPYATAERNWFTGFDHHVIVAGGIGGTPAFGFLFEMMARRRRAAGRDGICRVTFIYTVREVAELVILPAEFVNEAKGSKWLDLQLFVTGAPVHPPEAATKPLASKPSGGDRPSFRLTVTQSMPRDFAIDAYPANSARKVQRPLLAHPYMFTPWLWMVAVVLCFGGAFGGLICVQLYESHEANTAASRNDFTHVGMLQFAALGLGAVLPPAVLMLAVHLWWSQAVVAHRRAMSARTVYNPTPLGSLRDEENPLPLGWSGLNARPSQQQDAVCSLYTIGSGPSPARRAGLPKSAAVSSSGTPPATAASTGAAPAVLAIACSASTPDGDAVPVGTQGEGLNGRRGSSTSGVPQVRVSSGGEPERRRSSSGGNKGARNRRRGSGSDNANTSRLETVRDSSDTGGGPVAESSEAFSAGNGMSVFATADGPSGGIPRIGSTVSKNSVSRDMDIFITYGRPDIKASLKALAASVLVPPLMEANVEETAEEGDGDGGGDPKERDLEAMAAAAGAAGAGSMQAAATVAVMAGGPPGLVLSVEHMCRELNGGLWGRGRSQAAFLDFKALTHEL